MEKPLTQLINLEMPPDLRRYEKAGGYQQGHSPLQEAQVGALAQALTVLGVNAGLVAFLFSLLKTE